MEKILNFSLDDIEIFENDDDQDFAFAKLAFLSNGSNSHRNPISLEVLKRDAYTALGKFVIGKYNKFTQDTMSHENEEFIYGYVPPNGKIEFKEKDNKIFAVCDAVISKLYATPIVKMFKEDNQRWVSCEFSANLEFEEDELTENQENPILGFTIRGITILGKQIKPSCAGAEMSIIKFSEKDAEDYYNKKNGNSLKEFAERRRERMAEKTYKVDTSKDAMSDGEWDGNKVKQDAVKAKNFATIAPKIFMRLEDGWKDKEITKLGYPIMTLEGDTFVYSKKGLASAEGYARKENDTEVLNKVLAIKKKLGLEEGEKKEMAEIEGRKAWGYIIDKVEKHEKKEYGDKVYVDSIDDKKGQIIYTKNGVRYVVDADIKVGKDDEKLDADIKWDTAKKDKDQKEFAEEKKMEDDVPTTDKDDEEEVEDDDEDVEEDEKKMNKASKKEKKMSLDSYAESAAMLALLEEETEEYRGLAKDVLKEMEDEDKTIIMKRVLSMAKECEELRKFKADKEMEAKEFEVNKCLAEAKEDLSDKEFEDLKTEGMACKYEDMKAFENKVKAFAYNNSKNKTEKSETKKFAKMAFAWETYDDTSANLNVDDIYNKYL